MKTNQMMVRKSVALMAIASVVTSLPYSTPGWAILNNNSNPNSVNISSLEPEKVNCNDFCENLVAQTADGGWTDKNSNKEYKNVQNTSGGRGWSTTDDQFCANHGYATNPSVQSDTVSASSEKCNVTMLTTDGSGQAACKRVSDAIFRCQMHNSQVIPQCLAFKATKDAGNDELVVAALDTAAAAACGVACFTEVYSFGATQNACRIAGGVATAGEVYGLVKMNNGTVAKTMDGMAALAGAGALGMNGLFLVNEQNAVGDATNAAIDMNVESAQKSVHEYDGKLADAASDQADIDKASDRLDKAKETHKKNQNRERKASCVAAASFGVLSGLRYAHYIMYKDNVKDACSAVQSLASSVLTGNPGLAGNQGAGTGSGFGGITTANGTVGGNGSGGSNGSSARGTNGSGLPEGCTESGCSVPQAIAASATDGGVLKESGLDKLVAKPAADLVSSFQKGMTPAQAIQSAMAGHGGGEAGGALAAIAQAAQEDASSLGGKLNLGSPSLGSGAMYAGGGGGGRSGSDGNPFGNLFGGGAAGTGGARSVASEEFGKGRVTDIWHTGTSQNLFEIVSGKVSQVVGRVGAR